MHWIKIHILQKKRKIYRVMIAWVVSLAESFTIPDAERLCWLDDGLLKMGRTTVEKNKIK